MNVLFAFGLGYSAEALAINLAKDNWQIFGTSRTKAGAAKISALGFRGHVFDDLAPVSLPERAHWLISIPPDQEGCPVIRRFGHNVSRAESVTYLSTTGVYGNLDGGWAFEWTKVNPLRQRSINRVTAESQWLELYKDATIVRLPGIYGPNRNSFDRIRLGTARRIDKPGQIFSRIHVDDLASGLKAILSTSESSGVVNLTDDHPAPQADVIAYSAQLIGADVPPLQYFHSADLSPIAREFYSESKRVSNARAKSLLGWKPQFPSFKEGIAELSNRYLQNESNSQRP